jgi:hypothetical protein
MGVYKGKYRVVEKKCKGCGQVKSMPTRNDYCSRACSKSKKTAVADVVPFGPKKVYLDIETFPNLAYVWDLWEANALDTERETIIACVSVKWDGGEQFTYALTDFPLYKTDEFNDEMLLRKIWEVLDEADIVVAHNGKKFDLKKLNARFAVFDLGPPSPYRIVDTLEEARKNFSFPSNRLNDLGKYLKCGMKVPHTGFKLWKDCMQGVKEAWRLMKEYNEQDVVLLERVYRKLLPWMKSHPNVAVYNDGERMCPKCGSTHQLEGRGYVVTQSGRFQKMQCQNCRGWSRWPVNERPRGIGRRTLQNA